MPYFVYVLRSIKTGRLYCGSCGNIQVRLKQHNAGQVASTRPYRPWELLRSEEYTTKSEARKRELQLKNSGVARKQLKTNPQHYMPPSSSPV
ncbi:MAG: GIY-YIG nuclease family protein [Candidatus Kerfeldbacteria bacterium]|nr:GIY-YIG nuclease family protein [Candidatus Kerfeldbacteria bacterium]